MQYSSCNLNGECEDDYHSLQTEAQCQQRCRPLQGGEDAKEVAYTVLEYNLEQALEAAPSDRVRLIRRMIGVTVPSYDSWDVISALFDRDYYYLYNYPFLPDRPRLLRPYVLQYLDEFDVLMLELLDKSPRIIPDWYAVKRYIQRDFQKLFLSHDQMFIEETLEENPVHSLEELTSFLKRRLAKFCQGWFDIKTALSPRRMEEIVDSHWEYLQREFGEQIPYQHLIQA